jgi:hypothetical protein
MSIRILIPSGAFDLGNNKATSDRALAAKPDLITIDGGSTDFGPSYLGGEVSKYTTEATKI